MDPTKLDIVQTENLALDLRKALEELSKAPDLNRADLFDFLGTLKVNLIVLGKRIDSFLKK